MKFCPFERKVLHGVSAHALCLQDTNPRIRVDLRVFRSSPERNAMKELLPAVHVLFTFAHVVTNALRTASLIGCEHTWSPEVEVMQSN